MKPFVAAGLATGLTFMLTLALTGSAAQAKGAHIGPVKAYVEQFVKPWLTDPLVISALKAQNAAHAHFTRTDIDGLDAEWRVEADAESGPMIDAQLANPLSQFLKSKQHDAGGVITEIFITDSKGLNAGQSDVTSDYWQGDEDKWKKSFGAGPDAVFIDEAVKDDSTQMLQSQASLTIKDPATGEAIGAITVGINLDSL
ncbi:hypothetical protein [Pararhizobium sp.]|uniref:hypothetical protein n=1 Tax=Pararhizobium sp. TaxID=1977563 RepID=UPI002726F891|nr:hypothetical protein [Pararhizobium sp.]MDO9416940.1 hypothetical protein [Pararhizobium sp.]